MADSGAKPPPKVNADRRGFCVWVSAHRKALLVVLAAVVLFAAGWGSGQLFDSPDNSASKTANEICPKATVKAGETPPVPKKLKAKLTALAKKRGHKAPSLEAPGQVNPLNIAGGESKAATDLSVTASPAIIRGLKPEKVSFDVPQHLRRIDEKISTAFLPTPTFTRPTIIEGRKKLSFGVCFDVAGVGAGTYVGQIDVNVPGYQPGTITLTVNDKDSSWFTITLALAIVLAFFLLVYQAAQTAYAAQKDEKSIPKALAAPFRDLFGFWGSTVFAIVAVFGATWGVYAASPAWGADHVSSAIALVGTAVAAAGLGNLVSGIKKTD